MVYLQESDYDLGVVKDPITYEEAIECDDSSKWMDAMKDEIKSMEHNKVWNLVELPQG